jgi:4-hydroxy-tetrahydrodipicolinate synthase
VKYDVKESVMSQPDNSSTTLKTSRRRFLELSTTAAGATLAAGTPLAAERLAVAQQVSQSGQTPSEVPDTTKATRIPRPEAKKAGTQGCPPEIRTALSGPWPSLRTPFTRRGEIDYDGLRSYLDFVIHAGAKAVVLTWGDSLYSILTDDEIAQLTKAVVSHVNKRAFVVAATDTWWTGKAVEFARYCVQVGADMLMVLPPDWAHAATVDSLVAHYAAVAEHIPVMVVTNYLASRQPFGLDVIKAVYQRVPGVVALKDDVCGEFIRRVCLLTHDRWALSAGGYKENHMNMLPYGVDGYLSTFMTFKPEVAWRYWKAIEALDLETARTVIRDYDLPLFERLRAIGDGAQDAGLHGIYELVGIAKRYRRPPYYSLSDKEMEALAEFLRRKKIL